jgi:hypothetical protein
MSIMRRLMRVIESMSSVELDERDKGGMRGEQIAEDIIVEGANEGYIRNPLLQHPRKPGVFFETDLLVYENGTLFCIEIKNFRGRVYYPSVYRIVHVTQGWFVFKRQVEREVFDHYDISQMVQEKIENNRPVVRSMRNPLLKTQDYANDLRHYLDRLEPRLHAVPIIPVLGFAGRADISAVHDFEAGIIRTSELADFFERHGNKATQHLTKLVHQTFRRLPTWDLVITTKSERLNGIIVEAVLPVKDKHGRPQSISYSLIDSIDLRREPGFSAYDELVVTYTNGQRKAFQSDSSEIHLRRFGGEVQTHKLRNLNRVVVGIANKTL